MLFLNGIPIFTAERKNPLTGQAARASTFVRGFRGQHQARSKVRNRRGLSNPPSPNPE